MLENFIQTEDQRERWEILKGLIRPLFVKVETLLPHGRYKRAAGDNLRSFAVLCELALASEWQDSIEDVELCPETISSKDMVPLSVVEDILVDVFETYPEDYQSPEWAEPWKAVNQVIDLLRKYKPGCPTCGSCEEYVIQRIHEHVDPVKVADEAVMESLVDPTAQRVRKDWTGKPAACIGCKKPMPPDALIVHTKDVPPSTVNKPHWKTDDTGCFICPDWPMCREI